MFYDKHLWTSRDNFYQITAEVKIENQITTARAMKAFGSFTAFFTLFLCASALERARYDNYHVVKVAIETDLQYQVMQQIEENPDGVSRSATRCF